MNINESTTTIDVAGVQLKTTDLIYRIYTESILGAIGAKIEVAIPQSAIFAFKTIYGKDLKNTPRPGTPFGKVLDDFTYNGTGITKELNEKNFNAEVTHKVLKSDIDCSTARKLKSKWSLEAMQDFVALAPKLTVEKLLSKELLTELLQEVDLTGLKFMAKKATKVNYTIKAPNDPLVGVELYNKAQAEALSLVNNVKKVVTVCVTAPYITCAKLMSHPNFKANTDFTNAYYMGDIGATKIFCDPYGIDDDKEYMLISYVARDETIDGSTVFAVYDYSMLQATDPVTGELVFYHYYRTDLVQNPLDSKADNASPFLKMIKLS